MSDDFETITQPIITLTEEELEWARVMRARKVTRDLRENQTKALEALYNESLKKDDV